METYRSGCNEPHSKCGCRVTGTWVRIPPSPLKPLKIKVFFYLQHGKAFLNWDTYRMLCAAPCRLQWGLRQLSASSRRWTEGQTGCQGWKFILHIPIWGTNGIFGYKTVFFYPIPKKSGDFGHRREGLCAAAQKSGSLRKIRRLSPEFWVYLEKTAVYAQSSGSVAKAFGYTEREKAAIYAQSPGARQTAGPDAENFTLQNRSRHSHYVSENRTCENSYDSRQSAPS